MEHSLTVISHKSNIISQQSAFLSPIDQLFHFILTLSAPGMNCRSSNGKSSIKVGCPLISEYLRDDTFLLREANGLKIGVCIFFVARSFVCPFVCPSVCPFVQLCKDIDIDIDTNIDIDVNMDAPAHKCMCIENRSTLDGIAKVTVYIVFVGIRPLD